MIFSAKKDEGKWHSYMLLMGEQNATTFFELSVSIK